MKKSNKLLLGGFLTVILLVTGIHIALYAKYKNGHYTIYRPEDKWEQLSLQSFPGVSVVIISDLGTATVKFGDRVEVEKGKEDLVQYVQKGDSLFFSGRTNPDRPRMGTPVRFTLPSNITLSAINSHILFEKGKGSAEPSPVIYLQNSQAVFQVTKNPIRLNHVKLIASDNSFATFQGDMRVNQLEVQLTNSALEYNEGDPGQLSIVSDSISRLSLQSKHLLKAKITTSSNP